MDFKQLSTPAQLERNSFLWSELRLVIAAVALLLGGVPPVVYVLGGSGNVWGLLKLFWIISGLAAAYLGYRWYTNGWRVLGGSDRSDVIAMGVAVVTGLNLGWAGLSGNNIGMSIVYGRLIYALVGIVYLWAAWHLRSRWKSRGRRLF